WHASQRQRLRGPECRWAPAGQLRPAKDEPPARIARTGGASQQGNAARGSGGRLVDVELLVERDDSGDDPLVPHLVHLALEVVEVVVGEVGEPALLEQIVLDRNALHAAVGDVARLPDQL